MKLLALLLISSLFWALPPKEEGRQRPLLDVQLVQQKDFKRDAITPFKDDIILKTTLYNPGADTLRFLAWKCSFADYFELKNAKGYQIQQDICEKNHLEVIELPPNTKWIKYIGLLRDNYEDYPSLQFKVGFKFIGIAKNKLPDLQWLRNREAESATIWSKTVYLKT